MIFGKPKQAVKRFTALILIILLCLTIFNTRANAPFYGILISTQEQLIYEVLSDTLCPSSQKLAIPAPYINDADIQYFYKFARTLVKFTNMERQRHGMPRLIWDADLAQAAWLHSMDMATNNFASHVGSNGLSPASRVRQQSTSMTLVGENIAGGIRTPEYAIEAWMRSPGHKANILNENFKYIGIGVYTCEYSRWGIYITQKFGQ